MDEDKDNKTFWEKQWDDFLAPEPEPTGGLVALWLAALGIYCIWVAWQKRKGIKRWLGINDDEDNKKPPKRKKGKAYKRKELPKEKTKHLQKIKRIIQPK